MISVLLTVPIPQGSSVLVWNVLEWWFSDLNVHQNHPEGFLTHGLPNSQPKFQIQHVLKSNPPKWCCLGGAFERWLGQEGSVLMNGVSVLKKETPGLAGMAL